MRISPAGRLDGAQDAARGGGLAAAALADQAERLALVDVEVDAVDRAHVADRPLAGSPSGSERASAGPATSQEQALARPRSFVEEAAHRVAIADRLQVRRLADRNVPAMNSGQRGWKGQPRRPVVGMGHRRPRSAAAARACATRMRGIERSSARVYGCSRLVEDRVDRGLLDDPAQVHHHHVGRPSRRPRPGRG